jgi:aspartate/tyrosine/aromatic aminotransferase
LRVAWERELREMVARMKSLRTLLAAQLATRQTDRDFSWLARHRGMFSLLGLDAAAIARLRERYHVYLPPDGRINVA